MELMELISNIGTDESVANQVESLIFEDPAGYIKIFTEAFENGYDQYNAIVLLGRLLSFWKKELSSEENEELSNSLPEKMKNIIYNNHNINIKEYSFFIIQFTLIISDQCMEIALKTLKDLSECENMHIKLCTLSTLSDMVERNIPFELSEFIDQFLLPPEIIIQNLELYTRFLVLVCYNCGKKSRQMAISYFEIINPLIQSDSFPIASVIKILASLNLEAIYLFKFEESRILSNKILEVLSDSNADPNVRYNAYTILIYCSRSIMFPEFHQNFITTVYNIFLEANVINFERPIDFINESESLSALITSSYNYYDNQEEGTTSEQILTKLIEPTDSDDDNSVYAKLSLALWGKCNNISCETFLQLIDNYSESDSYPILYKITEIIHHLVLSHCCEDTATIEKLFVISVNLSPLLSPEGFDSILMLMENISKSFLENNINEILTALKSVPEKSIDIFHGADESDYRMILSKVWNTYIQLFSSILYKYKDNGVFDEIVGFWMEIIDDDTLTISDKLPVVEALLSLLRVRCPDEINQFILKAINSEISSDDIGVLYRIIFDVIYNKIFEITPFIEFISKQVDEPPVQFLLPLQESTEKEFQKEFYINYEQGTCVKIDDYSIYMNFARLFSLCFKYLYEENSEMIIKVISDVISFKGINTSEWWDNFKMVILKAGRVLLKDEANASGFVTILNDNISATSEESMSLLEELLELIKITNYAPFIEFCERFTMEVIQTGISETNLAVNVGEIIGLIKQHGFDMNFELGDEWDEESKEICNLALCYQLFNQNHEEYIDDLVNLIQDFSEKEGISVESILYIGKISYEIVKELESKEVARMLCGCAVNMSRICIDVLEEDSNFDLEEALNHMLNVMTVTLKEYDDDIEHLRLFVRGVLIIYVKGCDVKGNLYRAFAWCVMEHPNEFPPDCFPGLVHLMENLFNSAMKQNFTNLVNKFTDYFRRYNICV